MWPCNSIIIAFVWFVVDGKLTQNFKCGHFRIFFKISYCAVWKVTLHHQMKSQRECVFLPTRKLDPSILTDGGLCMWTWGQRCCLLWAPGNQAWDSSLLTHDEAPSQLQLQKIWGINWSIAAVSPACACSPANDHHFFLDDFFFPSVKMINFLQYYMCYSGSKVAQYVPWLTRGWKIVSSCLWTQVVLIFFI